MKIILCIGIIIVVVLAFVAVFALHGIYKNTYSSAWGIGYLYRLLATGEAPNGRLIVLEEIKDCTLIVQLNFNCKEEMTITDFSHFSEDNRLVGLQIFDTRSDIDVDELEPQIFHNATLKLVIEPGQKEEDAVWLWYLSGQEEDTDYEIIE